MEFTFKEAILFLKTNNQQLKEILFYLFEEKVRSIKVVKLLKKGNFINEILDLLNQNLPKKVKKILLKYLQIEIPNLNNLKQYIFILLENNKINCEIINYFPILELIKLANEKRYLSGQLIYWIYKTHKKEIINYLNLINKENIIKGLILIYEDLKIEKDFIVPFTIQILEEYNFSERKLLKLLFKQDSIFLDDLFDKLKSRKYLVPLSFYKDRNVELLDLFFNLNVEKELRTFIIVLNNFRNIKNNIFINNLINIFNNNFNILLSENNNIPIINEGENNKKRKNNNFRIILKIFKEIFEEIPKNFLKYLINEKTQFNALKIFINYKKIQFDELEIKNYFNLIFLNLEKEIFKNNLKGLIEKEFTRENYLLNFYYKFLKDKDLEGLDCIYKYLSKEKKENIFKLFIENYKIKGAILFLKYFEVTPQRIYEIIKEGFNNYLLEKEITKNTEMKNYKEQKFKYLNILKELNYLSIDSNKEWYFIFKYIISNLNRNISLNLIPFFKNINCIFNVYAEIIDKLQLMDRSLNNNLILLISNLEINLIIPILFEKLETTDFYYKKNLIKTFLKIAPKKNIFKFKNQFIKLINDFLKLNDLFYIKNAFKLTNKIIKYLNKNEQIHFLEISFSFIFYKNKNVKEMAFNNLKELILYLGVDVVFLYVVNGVYHMNREVRSVYYKVLVEMLNVDNVRTNELLKLNCISIL